MLAFLGVHEITNCASMSLVCSDFSEFTLTSVLVQVIHVSLMSVCLCIYMSVYVCVSICVCICMYVCMYVYIFCH